MELATPVRVKRGAILLPFWIFFLGSSTVPEMMEFPVPGPGADPVDIAAGPDGALWFTEQHADRIGRISTRGSVTEFALPIPGSFARGIAAGPDGGVWFTELPGRIGRISASGTMETSGSPTTTIASDE
jgi:virginiamycin B lyase